MQEKLALKKTQELLKKSDRGRENIEESVERVIQKPLEKKVIHPSVGNVELKTHNI